MSRLKDGLNKYFLNAAFSAADDIGGITAANPADVRAENQLRLSVEGVGAGNVVKVWGRIRDAASYSVLATVSGAIKATVDISLIDQVYFECSTYDASGSPKLIVSGFFQEVVSSVVTPIGGEIVDTGSYSSPQDVSTAITVPADLRARIFVVGDGAPVVDPSLGSGATSQELFIVGTDDTNSVELNSTANLVLSGPIVLKAHTLLALQWVPGPDVWVEVSRNEI